jgi:hypothetical protein
MNLKAQLASVLLVIGLLSVTDGCGRTLKPSWHRKYDWDATKYFDDPQVIQLCQAIEANDVAEVDRLIADGADVNAKGKGNMTPLLWAFPGNKPELFKRLLEEGADPNVIVESDFNTKQVAINPGDAVIQMAAKSNFQDHFRYVMEHGGDPDFTNPHTKCTLLKTILMEGGQFTRERVELLIEKRADLNKTGGSGAPPVIDAVSYFGQFDIALLLLKAGADPNVYIDGHNKKLVHIVLHAKRGIENGTPQHRADYHELVEWLEGHGQSFEEAQADYDRWYKQSGSLAEQAELRKAEVAERKAREKAQVGEK